MSKGLNGPVLLAIEQTALPEAWFFKLVLFAKIAAFKCNNSNLSVTMGYSAEGPDHPEVQKTMNGVMAAGQKHGVTVGIQVASAPAVTQKQQWGAPYIGIAITPVVFSAFGEAVKAGNPSNQLK
ncbi:MULTISPECIES: hypothetical protein [unclassified Paenibacillus]|uniref:hypothetical protein n=1 Tax=unclassified Paenibacillus TaxID=185978 RepID=UPI001AE3133C|nr:MULTISPECIES: hypothetical protein [unclassified Paenibacillus]MBP1155748.1 hypothetical protein [Paenibacillus sp. PvP091]MBP1168866.1 hypothetical protein [Paenibacillus sp. PvR098]MBP2439894.1 hypothetical protein [Paenibacillus sp. PvP052]